MMCGLKEGEGDTLSRDLLSLHHSNDQLGPEKCLESRMNPENDKKTCACLWYVQYAIERSVDYTKQTLDTGGRSINILYVMPLIKVGIRQV
jgi:hypothetical protein